MSASFGWARTLLVGLVLTSCGGSRVDPEAVRQIAADLRAHGAGPGAAPDATFTLSDRMAHHAVPGVSIGVVDDGRLVWARGFGLKAAGSNDTVTAATRFQVASISKPLAASAMLRMVQEGLLDLDRPIDDYLESWSLPPGRQTVEQPVTLRRIVSHSAGFTVSGFPGYVTGKPVPTIQQVLDGAPPANTGQVRVEDLYPGEAHRYSGGGYTVMQLLLQDVTEEPFPLLMRRWVLDPLDMHTSGYEQPLPDSLRGDAAAGHTSDGDVIQGRWRTYPEMAAAGLWSTPTDLLKWAMTIAVPRADFLSEELVKEMLTPQFDRMGLGVVVRGTGPTFNFSHSGSNVGYRGRLVYYPEVGKGAVVLTNGNGGAGLGPELLAAIADVYEWPEASGQ